ncbi:MAG: M55 family metallopeptidase [Chthonomonas sp.]|nr:M55 family metallopeptidase [Chthonomonas sp.]
MKVYISADIEGVSGIISWSQCGRPNGEHYDYAWARQRMTADVNSAIRGAKKAGATEIVVKDSHGNSKNLLADQLEPGTRLITGHGASSQGMMAGIDRSFAAAMLIGYHAMAGTQGAVMEHTVTGFVHRLKINGKPAGEIALSAGVAGCYDVPVVAVSSDAAGCAEALELLPGVRTASVKTGMGRYMAECLHPSDAEALIEKTAFDGLNAASTLDPWLPDSPTTITIELNRSEEADLVAVRLPNCVRADSYTVEVTADSYAQAHQMAWAVFSLGSLGRSSHD